MQKNLHALSSFPPNLKIVAQHEVSHGFSHKLKFLSLLFLVFDLGSSRGKLGVVQQNFWGCRTYPMHKLVY